MTFKDMKQGYPVYMLHKGDEMRVGTGKVVTATAPRFPQQYSGQALAMVVDVTIEEDGTNKTYTMPADSTVVSAGMTVLSVDREGILRDVEAMKAESEDALASMEKHRARVESCDKILTEWNPVLAEKKKQEERIGSLENGMNELKAMMRALSEKLG
jgi:hypothetical protein|nr:MAG TPA: hypothetical protein [Caudoviricetes sp.]